MFDKPDSPAGSFKGYSFVEYLRRNKNGIKTLLGIAAGLASTRYGADTPKAMLLGLAIRFALDAVDYYLTPQS